MIETPEQKASLTEYIESLSEEFDLAAQNSANHAFNLGCWVGLPPVIIIVFLVFILTKWNWVAAIIVSALMLIALLGLANLTASIAMNNAIKRNYEEKVNPEIEQKISDYKISRPAFSQLADEILPEGSMLRKFIEGEIDLPADISG